MCAAKDPIEQHLAKQKQDCVVYKLSNHLARDDGVEVDETTTVGAYIQTSVLLRWVRYQGH